MTRPDPDALLALVQRDEARAAHGRLKVFFGAAPGVGKTFAMLEAARALKSAGDDVVVGVVETHGRTETARLLAGLEALPGKQVEYRGSVLEEFDLDAALARRPGLLLVDELAHTNAPGSRHAKRWQDVLELLDAGIDVYTTLNVQHVETLNDVVAQITGITVRETVPDTVMERADEIELVDLSPDMLLERLREGKVYVPEQAVRALDRFFRKGNLIALRELALRHTAHRVDVEMRGYMQREGIRETWPAAERLAVCLGSEASSARVIRAARRMAERLAAEWTVLHVESPAEFRLGGVDRDAVTRNLQLAEALGARTVILSGASVADEVLAWARANNVTRLVVGKPRPGRRLPWRGTLLDALVAGSGAVDIHVISGDTEPAGRGEAAGRPAVALSEYALAAAVVGVITAVGLALRQWLTTIDMAMLYLLGMVVVGLRVRRRPAVAAAFLSIAAFDFCFVPPFYTFAVGDVRYILTFVMMLLVAISMAGLTGRIRDQAEAAREREQRTAAAFALSRDIARAMEVDEIIAVARRHITDAFPGDVSFILPDAAGHMTGDDGVARWVFENGQLAGQGTATLPEAGALYLPLIASGPVLGVVRVSLREQQDAANPVRRQLLETFVRQAAVALERAGLAERNARGKLEVEAERLRTSLLSSLSHDLRTPLASIEGAASSLLDTAAAPGAEARRELAETILDESRRMTRLIANLLQMIRVESGALAVQKELQPLEDVVGVALLRLDEQLVHHQVSVDLPADLPLVPLDAILLEQVFINLLENAARYAPPGTPIAVTARAVNGEVVVSVLDRGPGLPPGEEELVFGKFYRASQGDTAGGIGLGLTICRAIVTAHGGRIWAERREGGGAAFSFALPVPPANHGQDDVTS